MNKIYRKCKKSPNNPIQKETFLYIISRAFERASYYGIRGILLFYMINVINLSHQGANHIYSFFAAGFVFSQFFGALLGDLVIGNKKTMLIGGILQALGAFAFCIPSVNGLYFGMGLILSGSGLYDPNIMSQFGKLYLNKPLIMDSGFSLFYFAVSIGALAGTFIITYNLDNFNYTIGFITGGIFMLFSLAVSLFIKEKEVIAPVDYTVDFDKRLLAILLVGVYWCVYDYSSNGFAYFNYEYSGNSVISIQNFFPALGSAFVLPIGITASIVWTYFYNSPLTKITIGFISGALALLLLLFLPQDLDNGFALIFGVSMFLLSLAEIRLGPILYSILTKNSNPKYLAIIISLSFIPSQLFMYVMGFHFVNPSSEIFSIIIGAFILSIIAIGLVILLIVKNKKTDNFPMMSKPQSIDI
ncbi:MAG: MFS transporter [Flavobacterium sp.]